MSDSRIEQAKSAVVKKQLPPYVYKQTTGHTYYAKVRGVYLGSFKSVEEAATVVAKVFSD